MQVPKEELKLDILHAAEHEFMRHGYKSASLRTIAKKANTTIGNLYHYFSSKESILEALIKDTPEILTGFVTSHDNFDFDGLTTDSISITELKSMIQLILPQVIDFDYLLSDIVIILLEGCEGTKFEHLKYDILKCIFEHLEDHLQLDPDPIFNQSMVHSFVSTVVYIAKLSCPIEDKKRSLLRYFTVMIIGLMYGTEFCLYP